MKTSVTYKNNEKGQNAIEYLLLFSIVIIAVLAMLSPTGFLTQGIDGSLDLAINSIENMATSVWP